MSYVPPKKGAAYIFYIGLISQADTKLLQANPTLAVGDVTVSIDGGAFNNLATLPDAEPNASAAVRVQLSADEMNGDNIVVKFSDAAGAEWCDQLICIQTSVRQIDDIPTAAQNADQVWDEAAADHVAAGTEGLAQYIASTLDPWGTALPGAYGVGTAGKIVGDNLNATVDSRAEPADVPTADITAIKAKTDQLNFTGTDVKATLDSETVTVGTNNDKTGYALSVTPPTAAQIRAEIDSNSVDLNAIIADLATIAAYVDSLETRLTAARALLLDNLQYLTAAPPTAAQVWANATRTLTQSAAQIEDILSGSDISLKRGDSFSVSLTDLGNISTRTKLWFTVKNGDVADTEAIIQITEAAGLTYLNGAAAVTPGQGSISIDDAAAGDITIVLDEAATALLSVVSGLSYDVQMLTSAGAIQTLTEGLCTITKDVTKATS